MKKRKKLMVRQGDVLIVSTDRKSGLHEVERENGRIVLAHGEATGHAHAIDSMDATLLMDDKTLDRYLDVKSSVSLLHEEHKPITLPSGFYEVIRQQTYTPGAIKNVAD